MYRKTLIFLLGMLVLPLLLRAQLTDGEVVRFIPSGKQQVKLYWKDDQGQVIGSLGRLKSFTEGHKQKLVFAMNGGMYQEDRSPLGLFVQEGKTFKVLNTGKGSGNFYLQPNGVFYITQKGKGGICSTREYKQRKDILYATQSGPLLLYNGKIHAAFKKGSTHLNVRNGIGILSDGRMLFVMSRQPVNFYDFALYFKEKGCRNALYLDGFVSRTYLPVAQWTQTDGDFGVIIGAVE